MDTIIILIIAFGGPILGAIVYAIKILLRMDRRQGAAVAAIRALTASEPGEEPEPDRRHGMYAITGGAATLTTLALLLRRRWLPVAVGAAALTATALALTFEHHPAAAGPPRADSWPTTAYTQPTATPAPTTGHTPPTPPPTVTVTTVVTTVLLAGGAPPPAIPIPPTGAVPTPSSSATAPGTTPPPGSPAPIASGSSCAVAVTLGPLLGVCL